MLSIVMISSLVMGCQSSQSQRAKELSEQAFGSDKDKKEVPSYTDPKYFEKNKK